MKIRVGINFINVLIVNALENKNSNGDDQAL